MIRFALLPAIVATPLWAQPSVIADLPVTAGLSAAVLGAPVPSLLEAGDDPHTASLRPSQARALSSVDLVVRLGGDLAPWLDGPTQNLAARVLVLEAEDGAHAAEDHDHEAEHTEDAHDEHAEEAHEDHADEDGHDHDHGMHAWLDPETTARWLDVIASTLTEIEPGASETYRTNAAEAAATIRAAAADVQARIAANPPGPILVVHDAWGPAAEAFGLPIAGSISQSDATRPGVKHLREIEARIEEGDIACLLAAPGDDLSQAQRLSETHDVPVVTLPLTGLDDAEGLGAYLALLSGIGDLSETCAPR